MGVKLVSGFILGLAGTNNWLLMAWTMWEFTSRIMTSCLNPPESHFHPLSSSDKANYMMSFSISKRGYAHGWIFPPINALEWRQVAQIFSMLMVPCERKTNMVRLSKPIFLKLHMKFRYSMWHLGIFEIYKWLFVL